MNAAKKREHRRERRQLPSWREYIVIEDGKAVRRLFPVGRSRMMDEEE